MGRRRLKFIAIAAFLLCLTKNSFCQDTNDFYYTPVERSFAQVQPPLYPSNRPSTYFEHGDNFRVSQPSLASPSQQPLYNEGHVRFPSPNYNQNPSPFQLPTGRSQAGSQYYVNQPDYTINQRQRFRIAPPHNYQLVHPASTKRPDTPQIHSVAYQNDPSKPEAFLGQVTLNNPDFDYLQNGRFKNIQFDGNSLKTPSHVNNHGLSNDDDLDNDNQDLFEHHRVTTYNPNRVTNRKRIVKPNSGRFSPYEQHANEKNNYKFAGRPVINSSDSKTSSQEDNNTSSYRDTSTEYKSTLDIEPQLDDDIRDISSFRELMKNNPTSSDTHVINQNVSRDADSNPSASFVNTDNMSKAHAPKDMADEPSNESLRKHYTTPKTTTTEISSAENNEEIDSQDKNNPSEEAEEDTEYVEYYDDIDTTTPITTTTTQKPTSTKTTTPEQEDEYEDYDLSEENITTEKAHSNNSDTFDVVVLENNKTMVHDDNFKHFVDTTVIDQTENSPSTESNESLTELTTSSEEYALEKVPPTSSKELTYIDTPSILGQEIVSVVTTKSVVNGTISIPESYTSTTSKNILPSESSSSPDNNQNDTSIVTTENWVVVASVQTSRSVSGARFLPFPTVEQEEKKQVLTEEDEIEESVTKNPVRSKDVTSNESSSASTENINDKLDSIQSELSSGVLSGSLEGDNKNIEIITETTTKVPITTTPMSLNVFTLKSTIQPVTTEKSSPEPLPVQIKKFTPRPSSTSTTSKPKKKLVTVMDDLAPGLLPPGYKFRPSFKDKRVSTTTTTTTTTTTAAPKVASEEEIMNGTQGRSIGNSGKNKFILFDNKSTFVSKTFKPKDNKENEDRNKKNQQDDLSKLLPPGFKFDEVKKENKPDIIGNAQKIDISALLPKDFKLKSQATEKPNIPIAAQPVDISAFLPPGFKLNKNETEDIPLKNIKIADVSNLLPPGFKSNETKELPALTTTTPSGGFKLIFPTRPNNKAARKTTTQKIESGPVPVTPKIQKGWPTRASTEFTGWPSPSTTPFSIEKLLEAQRNATATSPMPNLSTESATRRTTTTTTTTIEPPVPTTPGICKKECDIAATIKIVSGAKWVPELLDRNTDEWKILAKEVKEELNSVYSQSELLNKWYKGIRIDGFSKGSVLVDYSIEFNDVEEKVDTLKLKKLFHKSLHEARPGSYAEMIEKKPKELDPDVMLGDQPEEDRLTYSEESTKTIDKSSGKLEIGKFIMDPAYTEFIVLPKREVVPMLVEQEEESILPQWGIAVIVIAMASLLFVVIFGVTVLVSRQKSTKAKQPIALTDDMFRELDKNHMGGIDDFHQMKERDIPYQSGKRMSTAFIEQLAYQNPGDSWRSEWTPQLQKHMQHYTPDSGRGSQIYGTSANIYGYGGGNGSQIYGQTGGGGSQIYGHTGGGGSQAYGYMGDYPRSHQSRRRSDYDNNF